MNIAFEKLIEQAQQQGVERYVVGAVIVKKNIMKWWGQVISK